MQIDRNHVQQTFAAYVKNYDDTDPKIKLKIDHTYRVAVLCEQIARTLGLSEEEVDLSWLTGMLHDVGRFEQLKKYQTFNDAQSVDHAQYGADILFVQGKIRDYVEDAESDELLEKVIRLHNAYRLPESLSEKERIFSDILRDADKIDILKVNVEIPLEEIYNVTTEELRNAEITEAVLENFKECHAILKSLKRTAIDNLVGHISFVYEFVYPISLQIMEEQGYLLRMMNFQSDNKKTQQQFAQIRQQVKSYIKMIQRRKIMQVTLGKTGITVNKNGFGALPIQRVTKEAAVKLLHQAYEGGITFFDTARFYSDSEEKIGAAFHDMRDKVYIATKTAATTPEAFWKDLETSLHNLQTDHIDLYQFHNPSFCPKPGDGSGVYEAMLEAKQQGKVLHIGITNHRLAVAKEAIESGLYETLQFPFCYLATEKDLEIVDACKQAGMGFIAMKALSGGLITNSKAAAAFMNEYPHVLPIWGVQRENELQEFLTYVKEEPVLDAELRAFVEKEKKQLSGDFCRGCGYCMPCPVGIEINNCARMSLLLRRAPSDAQLTEEMQAKMKKIENCLHCNQCSSKCPYGLDTPALLQKNYKDYTEVLAGKPLLPTV